MPDVDEAVRARLALALDADDLVGAVRLARRLAPWFGVAKVGLELFSAAGPEAFGAMRSLGYQVFADLKLHDIPTTVSRAARVLGALGVDYTTLHAAGGAAMVRAGAEGFRDGALAAGLAEPRALAITILTSEPDRRPGLFDERVAIAVEAGCAGVVCAAAEVRDAKRLAPRLYAVVAGIRPSGTPAHDQATAATPAAAAAAGADLLVVGRAVTAAAEPEAAAAALAAEITRPA
jgi:orotidine-5'-phosphate decarboxylase